MSQVQKGYLVQERKSLARGIFNGLSKRYETFLDIFTLYQDRKWKKHIIESCKTSKCILDLACGTCRLSLLKKEDKILVGLDINESMIMNSGIRKNAYDCLVVGDAESLPFRENSFDTVVSCYLPKYVTQQKLIDSIISCTTKEGKITLYDFAWPTGFFSVIYRFYVSYFFGFLFFLASNLRSETMLTFSELPRLIKHTNWVSELQDELKNRGLMYNLRKLTLGTVILFEIYLRS